MKPIKAIQYKALFLLVAFSLNTVVGFACSLGVDMGFNSRHHPNEMGKQPEQSGAGRHVEHNGNNSHSDHHRAKANFHSGNDNNTVSVTSQSEENCCKDFVVGFNSVEKLQVNQKSVQQKIIYLSPFIITVFFTEANNAKGFVLHLRTPPRQTDYPPRDIRVFIKSFLI